MQDAVGGVQALPPGTCPGRAFVSSPLPPSLGSGPFAVISSGVLRPWGAPLVPRNHSVTDQGCDTIIWGGWGKDSGWASQFSFCLPLLTWDFEQVGL